MVVLTASSQLGGESGFLADGSVVLPHMMWHNLFHALWLIHHLHCGGGSTFGGGSVDGGVGGGGGGDVGGEGGVIGSGRVG